MRVPFNDLRAQTRSIRTELDAAIGGVLDSGRFLLGEQLAAFEQELGTWLGGLQAVGVGSGTDALRLGLLALEVGPGDDVITVANAGIPPVAAIVATGARPVFVDVDPDSHTIDPEQVEAAVGSRSRAILAVHLFGQPANLAPLQDVARRHDLALVEDCAQAHGARYGDRMVGAIGDVGAFSFYPTKNVGALGDAGVVATGEPRLSAELRLLRNYGWREQYRSERHALNSRLDEIQAAVLRVKLRHLPHWNAARVERASWYVELLGDAPLDLPRVVDGRTHVFHLFVVRSKRRDGLRAALAERGIGTAIHYPLPAHLQAPYREFGRGLGSLPVTELLASEILSLPLYPELAREHVERVAGAIREALGCPR